MKLLLELRTPRVAVAVLAATGLTASLGTGVATAGEPAVALERKAAAGSKADAHRPVNRADGRKVG